jgi:LacI family xylobiose transport system transcriptional regulator
MQDRAGGRRARGEIEQLPSGSLRVRVYLGIDRTTGKRRYLQRTVPAGPAAQQEAEAVRAALISEVRQHRELLTRPEDDDPPAGGTAELTDALPHAPARTKGGPPRGRGRGVLTVAAIAQLAGVSAPTVSKVLNGRADVAQQTRSRVEAALRDHGYRRPEYVTRAATLEVVFYGMQSNMAIAIMHGVERVASEQKMTVSFTNVAHQVSAGRSWAHDLLARRPTGVIAVHLGYPAEHHGLLTASAIPVVALDPTGEPDHPIPSVGATNWSGGIAATRHLLDLGHRRIGVITGPTDRLSARARLEGARAAMDAEGVPLRDELVRQGGRFAFEDGLDLGLELLQLPDPPTAILCGNDLQALGVYEAARRAHVRIPDELSVVGFDGVSFTQWCGPPMTTVRQPLAEMGATAAQMVLSLAAGRALAHTRVELATTLVVRESTAPPRRA